MLFRSADMADVPRNHYGTIYADPPWGWMTYGKSLSVPQRAEQQHYPTMTIAQMQSLPVCDIAAKDCVLHMWVISSHVQLAFTVAEAWGFAFKSLGFNWVKTQKGDPEAPKMGMGKWLRQESELSLLFTKGKPKRTDAGVRQVLLEPAREHSRKPGEFRNRAQRLSGGPYLEMFGRQSFAGWDTWSNEPDKFDRVRNALDDHDLLDI